MRIMYTTELTSRRLSDAFRSDLSIRSWTDTKWLGSDFCLPQLLEGGSYEPNEPPLRTGLILVHFTRGNTIRGEDMITPTLTEVPSHFWGAEGAPILFSEIGFCVASCSYIYI